MTRWYVVHTQTQAEERAIWHLANQGLSCFLPRIRIVRRHARKVTPVLAPLFPRYLFLRFELDVARWRAINGTRGVGRLLTMALTPCLSPSAWLRHYSPSAISNARSRLPQWACSHEVSK
jgi:transcriptional antiterminator RfaH